MYFYYISLSAMKVMLFAWLHHRSLKVQRAIVWRYYYSYNTFNWLWLSSTYKTIFRDLMLEHCLILLHSCTLSFSSTLLFFLHIWLHWRILIFQSVGTVLDPGNMRMKPNQSKPNTGQAKAGLQLWIQKTQSLLFY